MADKFINDGVTKVQVTAEVDGKTGLVDFNSLKSGGIIKQRQKDLFTVRLRSAGGRIPLQRLEKIVQVAKKYGRDYVHLSFRQSLEIPFVDYRNLKAMFDELAEGDQKVASCGPRVRVPTACSGCEYNPNGLMDTQKMAQLVDREFFGKAMPHKFKISFSGCPIDCARTNEMDLGFQGAIEPGWDESACTGCRVCAKACKEGAIVSDPETGKPIFNADRCLYCADCIRACPSDSWQEKRKGWIARVGGKHGRHPTSGQKIAEFLTDSDVPGFIQAVIDWYAKEGAKYGRTRIGEILQRPEEWKSFIAAMREGFSGKLDKNARQPVRNEIHHL